MGAVAIALLNFFPYPGFHPSVWEDLASAVGLRPPAKMFPGLFRAALSYIASLVPPGAVAPILHFLGSVAGGLAAALFCLLFGELLPGIVRERFTRIARGRFLTRLAQCLATLFFICNDAVWRLAQTFSGETLLLLLGLASLFTLARYSSRRNPLWLTLSCFFAGALSAESPAGFAALALILLVFAKRPPLRRRAFDGSFEEPNPLLRILASYWLTFAFLSAFALTLAVDISAYKAMGSAGSAGDGVMNSLLACLSEHGNALKRAATPAGWIMVSVVVFLPFLMAGACLPLATLSDKFMRFRYFLLYSIAGLVAWSQCCGFGSLWFRSWPVFTDPVKSDLLIAISGGLSATTLGWALVAAIVKIYLLNPARLATFQYQDAAETPEGRVALVALEQFNRRLRSGAGIVPFLLVATVVPMRTETDTRRMLKAIDDFVKISAEECENADVLMTDGVFDAGIELAARARGRKLCAISLFGGAGAREEALRLRALTEGDGEERDALKSGGATALRFWITRRPERLKRMALQFGSEFWHGGRWTAFDVGATLMTVGSAGERLPQRAERRLLPEEVLAVYNGGEPEEISDRLVKNDFIFLQWRLARLAQMRSDNAAMDGWNAEAEREQSLCDRLDAANGSYQALKDGFGHLAGLGGMRISPREGLKLSLEYANFRMAAHFAEKIVKYDPEDPEANFALGMNDFVEERYGRAEHYLKRVLVKRPDETAAINNLAVIAMRMKKYEEAVGWAERAVALRPDMPGLKRVLDAARAKLEESRR